MNYQKRCLNWVKSSIFYDIGTYIVADAVVGLLQSYNPTLNRYQVVSQRRMQHRVFLTYRDGGDVKHMLSGICALTLGLPFDQSSILVQNIVGVFNIHGNDNNNANRDGRDFQDNAENDVSADYNWKEPDKQTDETNKQSTGDERKQNLCTLVDDFGISPSYQQRIPEVQWPALIRTLRDPSCTTCVISMDQLLEERPNGKRHVVPGKYTYIYNNISYIIS